MKRREFLTASCIAGAAMTYTLNSLRSQETNRDYYEMRKYFVLNRNAQNPLNDFLSKAMIPAMNRIGVKPIGVLNVVIGPNVPAATLYVLLVHKSLESVATATTRLLDDSEFRRAGDAFLNASIMDPGYLRMESSLMIAFKGLPNLEVPENKSRIFELRTYESHGIKAAKKKIEMFNEGGEIDIFRKTGIKPVFFGETLIGTLMPNLTYMIVFDDMIAREKVWDAFRLSPEWKKLSGDPQYADTVSNITNVILRPTDFSQI